MSSTRACGIVVGALATASFGCGLPQRDNPYDPSLAPNVVFRVSPSSGSHQTMFTLDASESTNPSGSQEGLRFKFDLDDETWDAADDSDYEVDAGTDGAIARRLVLNTAMLGGATTGERARTVRVRVTGANGGIATAHASVVLANEAPFADVGGDLFVAPFREAAVVLDACGGGDTCTSTDPDGDSLHYEWRALGNDVARLALDTSGRRIEVQAPADSRPLYFAVTAFDGLASSEATVRVFRERQIWYLTSKPSRIVRVFTGGDIREQWEAPGGLEPFGNVARVAVTSTGGFWVHQFTPADGTHLLRFDARFRPAGTFSTTIDKAMTALDDGGLCGAEGSSGFRRLVLGVGEYQISWLDGRPFVFADGDDCLAVARDGVWRIPPVINIVDDVVSVVSWADGDVIGASEDGFGNRWVARPTAGGTDLVQFETDGTQTTVAIPGRELRHLAPHPRGLWAWDATNLELCIIEDGVAIAVVPDLFVRDLVADPETGALWVVDGVLEELVTFVDIGSEVVLAARAYADDFVDDATGFSSLGFDPIQRRAIGAVRDLDGQSSAIVGFPLHLRSIAALPVAGNPSGVAADGSRGALWLALADEVVRKTDTNRVLTSLPVTGALAEVPGTDQVWVGEQDATGASAVVRRRGSDGAELQRTPVGNVAVLDLSAGEDQLCVSFRDDPLADPGGALRISASGTVTPLGGVLDAPYRTASTDEGDCWVTELGLCSGPSAGSTLSRFPAGTSTAAAVVTSAGGLSIDCALDIAADPRGGGVWAVDLLHERVVNVDDAGTLIREFPTPFPSQIEVLRCEAGGPSCLDVWVLGPDGIRQFDENGELLLYQQSTAGVPIAFDTAN